VRHTTPKKHIADSTYELRYKSRLSVVGSGSSIAISVEV
jgi:hypothetical protein